MSNELFDLVFPCWCNFCRVSPDPIRHYSATDQPIPKNLIRMNAVYRLTGVTWLQFNVGYYLFAILFLVFDVETVLVFPWAVVMKEVGLLHLLKSLYSFLYWAWIIICLEKTCADMGIKGMKKEEFKDNESLDLLQGIRIKYTFDHN